MIVLEILKLFIETVVMFLCSILKAMFSVSDAVDSIKTEMIAAVFGVSVGAASFILLLFGVVSFLFTRFKER